MLSHFILCEPEAIASVCSLLLLISFSVLFILLLDWKWSEIIEWISLLLLLNIVCVCSCNKNDDANTHARIALTNIFTKYFFSLASFSNGLHHCPTYIARAVCVRAFYLLNIQIKLSNRQFSGFYIFFVSCIYSFVGCNFFLFGRWCRCSFVRLVFKRFALAMFRLMFDIVHIN